MEGTHAGSNAPPPFLLKTYEMVEDSVTNSIVSWNHTGRSFVVWNPPDFAKDLLPKYFKHNNFSSFVRQLNTYGFRKTDPDQWEFANEDFIRGQTHLLKNIHRRKPIHSHSTQGNLSVPLSDSERQEFEDRIGKLKRDKNFLQLELQRHKKENEGFEFQVQTLRECLHNLVNRQRQLVMYLAPRLQKPGLDSTFVQHPEVDNKKRRLLISGYLHGDADLAENIVPLQRDAQDARSIPLVNSEVVEKLESSLAYWEKVLHEFRDSSAQQMNDSAVLQQLPPLCTTEMVTSSADSDLNVHTCSINSTSHSRDGHSPELAGSLSNGDSPGVSTHHHSQDAMPMPKSISFDVNTKPTNAPELDIPKDRVSITAAAGFNDLFWQQFLTEAPVSSEPEDKPERRDDDQKNSENRLRDHRKYWWNANNIDKLTDQIGHLTPAEMI